MQEYYKILGLSENASVEEVERAYNALKTKYSKDRFLEGEAGNEAAKMLTKVETAYYEIMASKNTNGNEDAFSTDFSQVEIAIKEGKINNAQKMLDDISNRNAEWHYLQSVIFYKKNWTNESKKQLEIAMNMEPHNTKYSSAYEKLKQKMEFAEKQFHSGNANYSNNQSFTGQDDRQMGGNFCSNMAECFCYSCAINMCCSSCCR